MRNPLLQVTNRRGDLPGLSDDALLRQCRVDLYRASGPGGQKRNKTSSAVRIRHLPTGLTVIAEESRSQFTNKQRALRRLRQAMYLRLREEVVLPASIPEEGNATTPPKGPRNREGRLRLGTRDSRFWPTVGLVLDVLQANEARVADSAQALGISTGNLIDFLRSDAQVWQQANGLRARFNQKPLRS